MSAATRLRASFSILGWRRPAVAALAVGGPLATTLLAFVTDRELYPALGYVLVVAAVTALGGFPYGLVATIISSFMLYYYFTPPVRTFRGPPMDDVLAGVTFLGVAAAIGALISRERAARAAADASAEVARRLQRASESFGRALTPADVLEVGLREGAAAAHAAGGLIALLAEDGSELEVVAERGHLPGALTAGDRLALRSRHPLADAVRSGEPAFLSSAPDCSERLPDLSLSPDRSYALACLPLVVDHRPIGGLLYAFAGHRGFDDRERAVQAALARQAAQALERARLYEAISTAEARVSLLAEASELLAGSLDYERTLRRVVELAAARFPGRCAVDLAGEDGAAERVAAAGSSEPDEAASVRDVLRNGRPRLSSAVVCVPLLSRERVLGVLSLASGDARRRLGQADLELATSLAGRVAAAIENALLYREAERRADAARALSWVGDAVVLLDRSGAVRYLNPAAERLAGVRSAEAAGRRVGEVVPGWASVEAQVRPSGGGTAAVAAVAIGAAGEERWFSVAAVDFGDGRVYALRDVTAEQALERARSDFVATASHELRTPLAAVYGAVRTLRRGDVALPTWDRERVLDVIESQSARLTAIVGQILSAAELDERRVALDACACDVPALVRDLLDAARAAAPAGIELELEDPAPLPAVRCDEAKLRQVLASLVENAVKYSPGGGRIAVRLGAAGGRVRIAVSDHGLGIPAAEQQRVFEKFARLDPDLARGVGGSGLGLYIARELTERMGGRIRLRSSPGSGSTFEVELPLEPPA